MHQVGADEAVLFFWRRVVGRVAGVRGFDVVVVAPFRLQTNDQSRLCQIRRRTCVGANDFDQRGVSYEVVRKLEARQIRVRIFKVDDDELFVLVGGKE